LRQVTEVWRLAESWLTPMQEIRIESAPGQPRCHRFHLLLRKSPALPQAEGVM
jgi:hypothetical protein